VLTAINVRLKKINRVTALIYTHGTIPQQHIAKEYYTRHNNKLVHSGLAAVIYGKSLNYSK